jgi:hypothetical protein
MRCTPRWSCRTNDGLLSGTAWYNVDFDQPFNSEPHVFATLSLISGGDPAMIRAKQDWTTERLQVRARKCAPQSVLWHPNLTS